jgi:hypothetical protein
MPLCACVWFFGGGTFSGQVEAIFGGSVVLSHI